MYEEIPYKFKYMLNKILNCIVEYILRNQKNYQLVESKLLLINNHILDIFQTQEISKFQNVTNSNNCNFADKNISPEHDKNITLSKFTNIFFNIKLKGKDDSNEPIKRSFSPFKDRTKIMKLKKLLKLEQEKSMIKELSYLKKLSFIQEKLNYYESQKSNTERKKKNYESDYNNISFLQLKPKKNLSLKINKNTFNNFNYLTMIKSCKNKNRNFFTNTSGMIKHSLSNNKIDDKDYKNKFLIINSNNE